MNIDDIKTIGVLGGGLMGQGISQSAILAGYKVICRDLTDEIVAKTMDNIANGRFGLAGAVQRGKLTQEQADKARALFAVTSKVEDLKNVDFMIEAIGGTTGVMEDKGVKIKVFGEMDKVVKKEAIFASNTSFFTIADLAAVTTRKDRFIGMHFFSPVPAMPLIELVRGAETVDATEAEIRELAAGLGKQVIVSRDRPGFIVNRVLMPYLAEAMRAYDEGLGSAEDIDAGVRHGLSNPMGPLELSDFIGLDVCLHVMEVLHEGFHQPQFAPPPILRQLVDAGYLGQKTGRGFYRYPREGS